MEKIKDWLLENEEEISTILGFIVVLIIGILTLNYFVNVR